MVALRMVKKDRAFRGYDNLVPPCDEPEPTGNLALDSRVTVFSGELGPDIEKDDPTYDWFTPLREASRNRFRPFSYRFRRHLVKSYD